MDKPSSSKLPGSIEEIKEENLHEENVEGKKEISSTEGLQQRMLEIPLEEQTTLPRSFRKHGSPSPYPRTMATSSPYSEQRQNKLPRRVNISSKISTQSHQEIPRNTTPIVKIRAKGC
ncbi:hypothetical protein O181_088930 [Austropuccinia psidii MF-1]|uniref:Uncharacterized protein n=1 Tax=Austropuccinia psidii MF-1 TaxID=1389203 RepID=A0A9Q3P4V4_9BASI|nr:hypothetical protein [Austropuccinia psidii MF-1]